jgi:hypothetical protein
MPIDWSDYPAPWSPETIEEAITKPISLLQLKSIKAGAYDAFLERQALRDHDDLTFRIAFTNWLNHCARDTASSGFSTGKYILPVPMGEFFGNHEIYKYVKGWSKTINGKRVYDKKRWSGSKTPFEKVVEKFEKTGIRVHNVSTFHSLIVIIDWQ